MATKFKQGLDVTGNILLSGTINAQGNVTLGDSDADSVSFTADVNSHIKPDLTATYDLGIDGKSWRNLHIGTVIFEGSTVDGNETTIGAVNPTADRSINFPNSSGTVATETWVNAQGFGAGAGGSINGLSDVDTATSAPSTGQVLKWNGTNWTPQADVQSSYTDASVNTHLNQSSATSNQVLSWSGTDYTWVTNGSGSLSDVVGDTTPQLGGNLDLNSNNVTGTGNISITGDLTVSGKALYSNVYTNVSDLPSASTYHGMFAHVHGTGKAYFAHGGAWIVLIDESSSTTTNLTEGTNLYYTDARVNTHLNTSGASSGQILSWNGSDYAWVADQTGGGGGGTPGGANTQVQYNNSGAFGAEADFTYNASTNTLTVVNLVATSISTTGAGSTTITAGANIELNAVNRVLITDTPFRLASFTTTTRNAISSPVNGDMIYNTTTNQLESYENSAWVATAGSGGGGGIASVVADTTPQLGGSLDVNGQSIVSVSNGDIAITPNGSGKVILDGLNWPIADGTAGQQLTTDGSGNLSWAAAGGGGIASVVADTTPQLGGDLDVNGKTIAHTFTLGANGSSDYTFSDAGNIWFPTTENDPVLYLRRGEQYIFVNGSGGSHPFQIRVSNGGSAYATGVTNNGASSGNIIFKVPMSAPATLYYQCTAHSGMGNTINIVQEI